MPPAMPTPRPTPISRRNSQATSATPAEGTVASSIIPIIRAIPTGSLNPDSPSRIVAERPSTSLPASTENVTAGSVGASAAPISQRDRPVEAEDDVGGDADERRRAERAEHPEHADRHGGGAEARQAHAHAAVEEDRDQRQRRDALHVCEREQGREPVGEIRGGGSDDEQQRGCRQADPAR